MTRSLYRKWAFWELTEAEREALRIRRLRTYVDVERLDDRVLPSVTTQLSRGILSIIADDMANQVQLINSRPGEVQVRESGNVVGNFQADQVQFAVFQHGAGVNTYQNDTGIRDKELRLHNSGRLTPTQLSQKGSLDALLVDNVLTLSGPSGAGFQIAGGWTSTTEQVGNQYRHTFTAGGQLRLDTALGDLVFATPNNAPMTITTTAGDLQAEFGAVEQVQWRADLLNTLAANSPLHRFQEMFGLQIDTGTVDLDVALGSGLTNLQMPLNNALPYITASTSSYTGRFGEITAQNGAGNPLTVALDPQDPALFARVSEFTAGASLRGYIPFRPERDVPALNQDPLWGHLYGRGQIRAGDVPLSMTADAVLNLDASRDGILLAAMSGNMASQIFTNKLSLGDLGKGAPQDLRVGVNGMAQVGYQSAGHDFAFPVNMTAVYTPGQVSLRGTAGENSFKNTPLEFVQPSVGVDVAADIQPGAVDIVATAAAANVAGLTAANLRVALTNDAASVEAQLANLPGFGQLDVRGSVNAQGKYALSAEVDTAIAGFQVEQGRVTVSNAGVEFAGQITIPSIASVNLAGMVDSKGMFALQGRADITVAGCAMQNTAFTLTNDMLSAEGQIQIPKIGVVDLSGSFTSAGEVDLRGVANVTIAGFLLSKATFGLTQKSLTVGSRLSIPNVGDVDLAGTITSEGQVDLQGTANLAIAGFQLRDVAFTLSDTMLSAGGFLAIPKVGEISLAGSITSAGEVSLQGTADVMIAGFLLRDVSFLLSDTTLAANGSLTIPQIGDVSLAGFITSAGDVSLQGTADVAIAGFLLSSAAFGLTNESLSASGQLIVPNIGNLNLTGTITSDGQVSMQGMANVTIAGFQLRDVSFTLSDAALTASGSLLIPSVVDVTLSGTITADGSIKLQGTADVTVAGFPLRGASFTLTNSELSVAADLLIPNVVVVTLQGVLGSDGRYELYGTADLEIAGFALTGMQFTLNNESLSAGVSIRVPGVTQIDVVGVIRTDGTLRLEGTATVTVAGFSLDAAFALTQTALTVSAQLTIPNVIVVNLEGTLTSKGEFSLRGTGSAELAGITLDVSFLLTNAQLAATAQVTVPGIVGLELAGTVTAQGQFSLTGQANVIIAGFNLRPTFTLTNSTFTAAVGVVIPNVGTVDVAGTVNAQGQFNLTGQADVTIAGFNLRPNFTLTNTTFTVTVGMTIPNVGALNLAGTVDNQGQFNLTGQADVTIAGFNLRPTFTLTNTTFTAAVGVTIAGVGTINVSGTVNAQGQFNLTGQADVTLAGFNLRPNFTLTNTTFTAAVGVTIAGVGTINVNGTVNAQGQFNLTGQANVTIAGFNLRPDFTLTNTTFTAAVGVTIAGVGTINVAGTVNAQGQFNLTGQANVTLAGFNLRPDFTLTNTTFTAAVGVNIPGVGTVNVNGTVNAQGQFSLTGQANVTIAGFALRPSFTLTNTTFTAAVGVTIAGVGTINVAGTVNAQGQFNLTGQANVTIAGFNLRPDFTLTNTTFTAAVGVTIAGVGTINVAGTVNAQGQFNLTGQANVTIAGFALRPNFTLTNTTFTAAVGVAITGVGTVNVAGTVNAQGQFNLTGQANVTIAGFNLRPDFTLTNTTFTAAVGVNITGVGTVNVNGTVNAQGQFNLTGQANVTIAGFALRPSFTLTNTTFTAAVGVAITGVGTVNVAGTVNAQGQFNLTGQANVTIAGFAVRPTFTLTNTTFTAAVGITVANVGTINVAGTVNAQGQFNLTGQANVTIAGFALRPTFTLTNTTFTAAVGVTIANVGTVNVNGTVNAQGQFNLSGQANVTIAGFALRPSFTLTNTTFTAAVGVTIAGVGTINVSGTVNAQGQFNLAGQANVTIAGFNLRPDFTLTNTTFTAAVGITIPNVGTVNVNGTVNAQGQFNLTGQANVTIAGFAVRPTFTLTNTTFTAGVGITVANVGTINVSGTVNAQGQFNLSGQANVTIAGFALRPSFTLTNTTFTAAVGVTIPNVGTINVAGTVNAQGQFNLTGQANVTIAGLNLRPNFTLNNTSLTVGVAATIPLVGAVNFSGTVNNQGQFSLSATAPNISILFVTLTNARVTLTNNSITIAARATNLPLIGTVDFAGQVSGQNVSFTATLPQVTILGFTLRNLNVALSPNGLTVSMRADNLPIVGTVNFSGQISANGFTLSAVAPNVQVAGFINLTNVALTLTQSSLALSTSANLPVVGGVTFRGAINANGTFTISATAPRFTLLGFITFENASVELSFPNPTLTVSARINLANIGQVDFRGTIGAGGRYSFSARARLIVAGFTLGEAGMQMGNAPGQGDCINIGPFTTPPLPVVGAVTLGGSYCGGGRFSFRAEVNPVPPIIIGGIPFNRFVVGLTNDSLTFGAGVGINFSGLTIAQAYFEGTIRTNGDFRFLARVDALQVLGFSAVTAQLTFEKIGNQVDLTLAAQANFIVAQVNINGFIRFATGQFELTGTANIGVAGFTLSSTRFMATNIGGTRVELTSRTNVLNIGIVNFAGRLARVGNGYTIDVSARATFQVAGFVLADAQLELNNTRLFISVTRNIPGLATANFQGTVTSAGQFDLRANVAIAPGGFNMANGTLRLTNNSLDITGSFAFPGVATVNFAGFFRSTGQFSLTGTANVGFGGFTAVAGSFTMNNAGVSVSGRVNVIVATVNFSGMIQRNGQYSMTGSVAVGLGGFNAVTGSFTINNGGASVRASVNVVVATVQFSGDINRNGTYSLTGSAAVGLGGFNAVTGAFTLTNSGASVRASVNVVVATVQFSGAINRNGTYSLTGSASVGLGGFNAVTGAFTLTNSGASVRASVNVVVATVQFTGEINRNGTYSLTGSAAVGLGGYNAVTGAFTLTNSGASVRATLNVVIATVTFNGTINRNGTYSLTGSASVGLGGYSAVTGAFTLTNSGASVRATVNVVVATVTFSGTINRNGTYSLTGTASVGLGGYSAVSGSFTLTNSGVSVRATLNVIVATVTFNGTINRNGTYSITGSAGVSLGGFTAVTGTFTLTNSGVRVRAAVNVRVATVTFDGAVNRNGTYSITATANANFAGFNVGTTFTISNTSGVAISARMGVRVMGFQANFNGRVQTNGSFSFTVSTGLNFGPLRTNLSLTLSNNGFRANVSATLDLSEQIRFLAWSLRVGFRGSFNIGFNVNTNGTFSASGNMQMCAYVGIGGCVGIGFGMNHNEIWVNTNNIGFSIWGHGFHPFGRLRFSY